MGNTITVRSVVLDAIASVIDGIQVNLPIADPYGYSFPNVTREPLNACPAGHQSAVGVYGGTSKRTAMAVWRQVILPVTIEVYANTAGQKNDDQSRMIESMMGAIERALFVDLSLGGLLANMEVVGDQVTVDGAYATGAMGALFLEVTYFQAETDPRQRRGF